jgi:hypothetical protein
VSEYVSSGSPPATQSDAFGASRFKYHSLVLHRRPRLHLLRCLPRCRILHHSPPAHCKWGVGTVRLRGGHTFTPLLIQNKKCTGWPDMNNSHARRTVEGCLRQQALLKLVDKVQDRFEDHEILVVCLHDGRSALSKFVHQCKNIKLCLQQAALKRGCKRTQRIG